MIILNKKIANMQHDLDSLGIITSNNLNSFPNLKHGFLTRKGGYSEGDFRGLNFGYKTGDDYNIVKKNYDLFCNIYNIDPKNLIIADQTHSNNVVQITNNTQKFSNNDALITNKESLTLAIITADCCPILLYDPETNFIAAIHAGWRSSYDQITHNTIKLLKTNGVNPENIRAAIFPTIAQKSYEVDENFRQNFLKQNNDNNLFFIESSTTNKYLFDLVGYNTKQLALSGIKNIEINSDDTFSNSDKYFSYRFATKNAKMNTGRHLTFISIAK